MSPLHEKLKEFRKKAKFTQEQVAEATGLTNTTISNWENDVSRPDVDWLSVLCKLYKVSPNEILEWDDSEFTSDVERLKDTILTEEEYLEIETYKQFVISKRQDNVIPLVTTEDKEDLLAPIAARPKTRKKYDED